MWAVFKTFFTTNALRLGGYLLAGLALLGFLAGVRKSGRDAEKVDNLQKDLNSAKEVLKQDNIVSSASTNGMRERLDTALRRKRDP